MQSLISSHSVSFFIFCQLIPLALFQYLLEPSCSRSSLVTLFLLNFNSPALRDILVLDIPFT
jgi:hypothetical protein